jgi:hypothetical protein
MRVKFEQAFINRTKLLNIQRGVVDATRRASRVLLIPGKMPEGVEQITVGDGESVEVLWGEEFTIQRRELEKHGKFFIAQRSPEHAERLPQVVMLGGGGAILKQPPQPGDAVMLGIDGTRTQQSTIFGDQQEEKTIDKAQELTVEVVRGKQPSRE